MSSLNVSSYLHIYIGLFDNKIQFGRQQAALPVGEAILQFIYYDFKPIVNRLHYSIDDFSPAHPFFRASSPQWQLAFINHIEKNDKAGDMPSLQDIIQLQDKYRHMMETLYESQSIADQKKFRDYRVLLTLHQPLEFWKLSALFSSPNSFSIQFRTL